jgi:cystathionine gamma-synthase
MAAVRGYEEKDPAVTKSLETGYPRFVVHPFARRLGAELSRKHRLGGRTLWLASSRAMAAALLAHLAEAGVSAESFERDGVSGVSHPDSTEAALRAKLFLQNIGGFLSSREAEDRLVAMGLSPLPRAEEAFAGDARAEVLRNLRPLFAGAGEADILVANSGMNAVHAAFRAVNHVQASRGRTRWIQLGWLYLDTIAILRKHTAGAADYIHVAEVLDLAVLERVLQAQGGHVAGVMAEVPSNPLVQTPDVARLAALCRSHGAKLVLDTSIASCFSVDCLPHCDLVVNSLTKYTGSDGDVIAGAVVVNPGLPDAANLRRAAAAAIEPPYARDLARLAAHAQGRGVPRVASRGHLGLLGARGEHASELRGDRPAPRRDRRRHLLQRARQA